MVLSWLLIEVDVFINIMYNHSWPIVVWLIDAFENWGQYANFCLGNNLSPFGKVKMKPPSLLPFIQWPSIMLPFENVWKYIYDFYIPSSSFRQRESIFLIRYIVESSKKNALGTHHRAERLLSNHLCDQIVQTLNNEKKTKLMTDQKNSWRQCHFNSRNKQKYMAFQKNGIKY